ncbi:unnamed protein product [Trypanosoma congolense IL3000]|uniref:Calcium uniporter protein C-terminal domain-containing protein n=1 Tax=Trypanosoma congolense (strain IL3000) TaxID=1068625 RepID=F9WC65_TRYCI|nr:conserved hypothetical protein [Trypanosoma congolense IL3000]CCD14857.1 unnamed protein product [Trypanosoma congolense IL3000]
MRRVVSTLAGRCKGPATRHFPAGYYPLAHLQQRVCCSTAKGGEERNISKDDDGNCLSFIPQSQLTRTSLPLYHSRATSEAPSSLNVAVIADVDAFNRLVESVFTSNEKGVNSVIRDLKDAWRYQIEAIAPKVVAKHRIDDHINNIYAPLLRYMIAVLLVGQFIVFFHWVFVVFDWNLVEPITYFIGYTTVWISLVLHCYSPRGLSLEAVLAERRRGVLYKRAHIDGKRVERHLKHLSDVESQLRRYGKV